MFKFNSVYTNRRILIIAVSFVLFVVIFTCAGIYIIDPILGTNSSAWFQTGLAFFAIPLFISQLYQLAQSLKPNLSIGVFWNYSETTKHQMVEMEKMPDAAQVLDVFPTFNLAIRNTGTIAAQNIKIHLQYTMPDDVLTIPFIDVTEFSKDKISFVPENDFVFIFRATRDWRIFPNDVELFTFTIVHKEVPFIAHPLGLDVTKVKVQPCEIKFLCRIWADGLSSPITQELRVKIDAAIPFQQVNLD